MYVCIPIYSVFSIFINTFYCTRHLLKQLCMYVSIYVCTVCMHQLFYQDLQVYVYSTQPKIT